MSQPDELAHDNKREECSSRESVENREIPDEVSLPTCDDYSSAESISDLSKSIDLDFDPPKKDVEKDERKLERDNTIEAADEVPSSQTDHSTDTPPPTKERLVEFKERPHRPSSFQSSLVFDEDRISTAASTHSPMIGHAPSSFHMPQRSDDSSCGTALSGSVTSFRQRFSQFSIDNSCFDLLAMSGENSTVGTPIEKVFPKDMYSAALLEKVARLEKALSEQRDDLDQGITFHGGRIASEEVVPLPRKVSDDTVSHDGNPLDDVTFPRTGSLKRKDTSGSSTSEVPIKEPAIGSDAPDKATETKVVAESIPPSSSSSSMSSLEPLSVRKESSVTMRSSVRAAADSPPGSPVVREKGGRLSIRAVRRHTTNIDPEKKVKPPRLDLVVGGPSCAAAPYPPTPSPAAGGVQSESVGTSPSPVPSSDSATPPRPAYSQPSTSGITRREERNSRKAVGRKFGNLRIIEILRVRVLQLKGVRGHSNKPLFIVAKLDNRDVHHSAGLLRDSCDPVLEEFCYEGLSVFSNLHIVILEGSRAPGKAPRPIGRVSVRRKELVRLSGKELTLPLRIVSKYQEVQGQICLDIRREHGTFALRVVDYSGLGLGQPQELYLLVTPETGKDSRKLRIHSGRFSEEWLDMPCEPGPLTLKMTLWHDLLKGFNSVFHGQVRVEVDERWTNGPSKWFYLRPRLSDKEEKSEEKEREKKDKDKENRAADLGEIRMWMSYTADHVMPAETYRPLMTALSSSISVQPFSASLITVLENLPQVDLGVLARPLVQALAFTNDLRPLLSALYAAEIDKCQDLNTLFRSQSLASKMLYELLKIYGHSYLLVSLKPVIDKIYKERKCCEIDPSRLSAGDSLDKNTANLLSYFSAVFSRVVESASRCPAPLKTILCDLRTTVSQKTGRADVERLALSSFLIMRFFAAAILNPKSFCLKRDQPEARVARTLVLLSKMLQRLANCCVSEQPLNSKEPWLSPVLERITDDVHRGQMSRFLDRVSLHCPEPQLSTESIAVLKEGYLVETRSRSRPAWRKMLHQKKRYVILTDSEVMWQKSHRGELNPKGSLALTDIRSLCVESKNIVVMRTETEEVAFEAHSSGEAAEWLTSIERQRNRARRMSSRGDLIELADTDAEREMEAIHILLVEHADTLTLWRQSLETGCVVPQGAQPLPPALEGSHLEGALREEHRSRLLSTLEHILSVTYTIETAHRNAVSVYMNTMKLGSGTRENPIGDDNYLLLKRKLHLN